MRCLCCGAPESGGHGLEAPITAALAVVAEVASPARELRALEQDRLLQLVALLHVAAPHGEVVPLARALE